ncbi:ATP-binding protein [Acinetobacter sp.]|uniref:ATP-binding protein n=1 Tax=Acinetobacter sp. TaxID=472 RepID=UPI003D01F6FF
MLKMSKDIIEIKEHIKALLYNRGQDITNLECLVRSSNGSQYINFIQERAAKKSKRKFDVVSVEKLSDKFIPNYYESIYSSKHKDVDKIRRSSEVQGAYLATFTDGSRMVVYAFYAITGNDYPQNMFIAAADESTLLKFYDLIRKNDIKSHRIKPGIYRVYPVGNDVHYADYKIKPNDIVPTVHPTLSDLRNDISFFYSNLDKFTRYGGAGTRMIALIGPPGTGKSSMLITLASEYMTKMSVIIATDLQILAAHMAKCAIQKKPTLILMEDVDSIFGKVDANILNFLDGVDQPVNPAGTYVIMTTNFPERIEPRILRRPGRIDRVYNVGELEGEYALECARLYFPEEIFREEHRDDMFELLDKMTGAQIKELAQSSISMAINEMSDLTPQIVKTTKERMSHELQEMYKYAEENSSLNSTGANKILGFAL